jgi:hypothetical protein
MLAYAKVTWFQMLFPQRNSMGSNCVPCASRLLVSEALQRALRTRLARRA